ncbi:MAG TPA: EamA family transporter [Flavitalea sp.]|nr:EamA family transporter [Flavitalea sp.]
MWWIFALLSAFFASLTAIFAKLGVKNVDSDLATAIRTSVVLILAWGIAFFKGTTATLTVLSQKNLLFLIISGVATGLSWIFYFKALQIANVSKVAPIDKLSVALTVVLSAIFLHESITIKTGIGVLLIVSGVFMIIK